MSKAKSAGLNIVHPADPIRVVPLHDPNHLHQPTAEAGAAPPAQLTYRNGPLLTSVQIYTIFWGSAWQSGNNATLANSLNDFFKFIVTSPYVDQLAEYNTGPHQIKHGGFLGTTTITTPAPKKSVSDAALQHFLHQELSSNQAIPQPTANTLYFIYTPPGTKIIQGGSSSCMGFCGYHNNIGQGIFYAAMPYAGCNGCLGGMNVLDAMTGTSSHELAEAITDAIPGTGWYDDSNGEIGDICAWRFKKQGPWNVQLLWSNKAGKCV
jgi:hypothetical protein